MVRQVEAKYPALLFKQQLTAYVEKIFGIVRDNLKKELSPLISACIQVRITSLLQSNTYMGNDFQHPVYDYLCWKVNGLLDSSDYMYPSWLKVFQNYILLCLIF